MHDGPSAPDPVDLPAAPRILLIRFSALGDVLLTFPAVLALRERWPDAHLAFLTDTRSEGLLDGLPAVNEVFPLDRLALKRLSPSALASTPRTLLRPLRGGGWDAVIDLQGVGETAWLTAFSGAPVRVGRAGRRRAAWAYRPFIDTPWPACYMPEAHLDTLCRAGVLPVNELTAWREAPHRPSFVVSGAAAGEWRHRCQARGIEPGGNIGLFVGAAKTEKRWGWERFGRVAGHLSQWLDGGGGHVLVFAGPDEPELATRVVADANGRGAGNVTEGGAGSLGALAAAWRGCRLVVSNDTGPMHLSVAVGTPTVGIFRVSMPHFTPPLPHRAVVAHDDSGLDSVEVDEVVAAAHACLGDQPSGDSSSS